MKKLLLIVIFGAWIFSNNLWAEPEPPKETAFTVEICKAEPEITLEVETLKEDGFDKAIDLMARCIEAEAGNQSSLGKRLVADVILNRVQSEAFPDSIEGVVNQPGQFSVVSNGSIDKAVPSDETMEAVISELNERIDKEIIYFKTGGYPEYGEPVTNVEAHYFSK